MRKGGKGRGGRGGRGGGGGIREGEGVEKKRVAGGG